MKVEIREDSVLITGYVNAIERYSKPIRESVKGKIRTFIERIKAGVFKTALKRNDDVKVLLNHNHDRVLATTKDGSAKLEEDNIGLRAEVTITDEEVVEKARNNQLVGWSFGFYANSDELGTEGNNETRTVTDLDLIEVSILDDTKTPAYYGTSIEARSEGERMLEYRTITEEIQAINEEAFKKHDEVFEDSEEQHKQIEEEKMNALIDIVVNKVLEKLNGTGEEKTIPKETPVAEEKVEEESRSTEIDYSSFEERIAKLK
jgi:HK97 family phage prohead protease